MSENLIGQILLGRYRVDAFIASGGMGAVYKVTDLSRQAPLAMKVLHSDYLDDPSVVRHFQREANALQQITHTNIVRFYGMEQSGNELFLLQEFINGPTLKRVLEHGKKPMQPMEAVAVLRAISAALGFAHFNQIIHCDVKPGNIMLDQTGHIYLADFGIAREAESMTTTFATAGTPAYMAPEQIVGDTVGPYTDVYALGIVFYEMMAGRLPFIGNETSSEHGSTKAERVRYAQQCLPPPDPRQFNPAISPQLAGVILRALQKDPNHRYARTDLFLQDVCVTMGIRPDTIPDFISVPSSSSNAWTVAAAAGGAIPLTDPRPANVQMPKSKANIGRLMAILAGAALVVFLGFLALSRPAHPPGPVSTGGAGSTINPTTSLLSGGAAAGLNDDLLTQTAGTALVQQLTQSPPQAIAATEALVGDAPTEAPSSTPFRQPQAGDIRVDTKDGMELVYVPAGPVFMGATAEDKAMISGAELQSESPGHTVRLENFWMDKTEVTNAMFQKFVDETGYQTVAEKNGIGAVWYAASGTYFHDVAGASWRDPQGNGKGIRGISNHPVVQMNWEDAYAYCNWVGGSLPTEAQWERAARGDTQNLYPWGNGTLTGERLNFSDVSLGQDPDNFAYDDGYKFSAPVGIYPHGASQYGILDLAGNVAEWVFDYYDKNYFSRGENSNPTGPQSGTYHLLKGGSWFSGPIYNRIANRIDDPNPRSVSLNYGFRCVRLCNEGFCAR